MFTPVLLSMPDPADAKLTPVIGGVVPINHRNGGDVGNPTFFAAKTQYLISTFNHSVTKTTPYIQFQYFPFRLQGSL